MENFTFKINNKEFNFPTESAPEFKTGNDEILSGEGTDITYGQPWYQKGYTTVKFISDDEFTALRKGLTDCVKNIIERELGVNAEGFELTNYHKFVTTNEDHMKVVSVTRDLYPEDFNFPILNVIKNFEKFIGFGLSDINPKDQQQLHIIIRINRPGSNDFNPPHKDIYEAVDGSVDGTEYIPQFVNIWIPIVGVTEKSSLPVVESSHLIPESQILRTREGAKIATNKYRVRMVKEWAGSNELTRAKVDYGDALFFSSHLVHGLAINEETDQTRVSLEYRLFKADS